MLVFLTVLLFSYCVFYVGKVLYCVRFGGVVVGFCESSFCKLCTGTCMEKFCLIKLVHEVADETEWTKLD